MNLSLPLAIVFLRAKHAGLAVLHMLDRTHDICFNIYLWLMNRRTNSFHFFSRELIFRRKLLESAILSPPWPDFQKKSGKNRSIWHKKLIAQLTTFFTSKLKWFCRSFDNLPNETISLRLWKCYVLPELYPKMYEKFAKKRVWEKTYSLKTDECFWFKISDEIFKTDSQFVSEFWIPIFWTNWEIISQRASGLGRAGSSRISNIWSKINISRSTSKIEKGNCLRDMALFSFPYDCGKKLSTASSLHVVRFNKMNIEKL